MHWGLVICIAATSVACGAGEKPVEELTFFTSSPEDPDRKPDDMVHVSSADAAWLETSEDRPLFVCGLGDPEDFLFRGELLEDGTRSGDQHQIIERLKETGANAIYIQAVRSHGGDGVRSHNPFNQHDPARGLNAAVVTQWRTWLHAMDEVGIVTYFFIYDDGACIWSCDLQKDHAVPREEAEFIHTLVDELGPFKNLVWIVAEEYAEKFSSARVLAIARLIREADIFGRPVGIHQLPGTSFDFVETRTANVFAMQWGNDSSSAVELHNAVVEAHLQADGRYNVTMSEVPFGGLGDDDDARRKMWAMAMGGAYVLANGWDGILTPRSRLLECGYMVQFFEAADPRGMRSRDEYAAGVAEYVMRGLHGRRAIAYSSRGKGARIGVKELPPGEYRLTWMDTANGVQIKWHAVEVTGAAETLWAVPTQLGNEIVVSVELVTGPRP